VKHKRVELQQQLNVHAMMVRRVVQLGRVQLKRRRRRGRKQ
jgi:hypothetical protein